MQVVAAFVCWLGWTTKVLDPKSIIGDSTILASPVASTTSDEVAFIASQNYKNTLFTNDSIQQRDASALGNNGPHSLYTHCFHSWC